jgi:GntR family transcriptional regulator
MYQYSMLLHVNTASGVPTYLQIETQVKHYIAAGALVPGDALPSVRKLAVDLRISTNTVARAYQDLERDGILRTVQGGRTYVAENPVSLLKSERIRRLRPYARQIAVEGKQLRLNPQEIMELVQQELDALEEVNERYSDLDRKSR